MTLLTVNTGSSSVRLAVYVEEPDGPRALARYHGDADPVNAAAILGAFLQRQDLGGISAVVHRIVHGGGRAPGAHLIDESLERAIEACAPLAPLHNPAALAWIRGCREMLDGGVQLAVFDTAFYRELPAVARTYALPPDLAAAHGLRRYGFHGLAHEAMWRHWRAHHRDGGRVISLQLGAGCSVTAVRDGHAIDTSMGFSPLEGLMMATRCGDIDPGLLLYLLRNEITTPAELESLLNERSGLLGVSGISGDMRELLASDTAAAKFAVALYAYRARKYLGAFLTVLGGVDAIVFGGGVGEHEPAVRAAILGGMEWAGIELDDATNQRAAGGSARIDTGTGTVEIHVVEVDEARLLAEAALATVNDETSDP